MCRVPLLFGSVFTVIEEFLDQLSKVKCISKELRSTYYLYLNFYDLFSVTKKNDNENCWPEKDFGTHNPVKKEVRLFSNNPIEANYSRGIGEFTVIIGLAPESKYCVLVEHVHHPYCTVHSGKKIFVYF